MKLHPAIMNYFIKARDELHVLCVVTNAACLCNGLWITLFPFLIPSEAPIPKDQHRERIIRETKRDKKFGPGRTGKLDMTNYIGDVDYPTCSTCAERRLSWVKQHLAEMASSQQVELIFDFIAAAASIAADEHFDKR